MRLLLRLLLLIERGEEYLMADCTLAISYLLFPLPLRLYLTRLKIDFKRFAESIISIPYISYKLVRDPSLKFKVK